MGGPTSGQRPHAEPGCLAGQLLLDWARRELDDGRGKALHTVAAEAGVSYATVARWITGTREPTARNALAVERVTGIPVRAWGG
jgi:plasmid maintenance system antidote protein VapI